MNWLACALSIFLLAMPDTPRVARLLPPSAPPAQLPPGETLPVLPDFQTPADKNVQIAAATKSGGKAEKSKGETLQPYSRLEIIRYVSGEFARVKKALPGGKNGFRYAPGKPLDESELRRSINKGGSVANPGDTVQITRIEFKGREIVVDINGGGRGRTRLRDHIQISAGSGGSGVPISRTSTAPGYQGNGSTLILDFGKALPDMTPEDVKEFLSPMLDFSKQRSATVNWVETLPPEMQQAIKERKAVVGMDREMVVAALGRPERKIRERDPDGLELEDWIYGEPPSKTVFVTFAGEKVIRVKEFPR
ncbi:MAG: hypothetical protein HY012_04260 [Acidobacteria bacterium]|nr:hypothetical protein [Acidobacteriota bacterium]